MRRDWRRVPAGTVLIGPPEVGPVMMGDGGVLTNGRTPNQVLTEAGLIRNAWLFKLRDGRTVAAAYDAGDFDEKPVRKPPAGA